MTPTKPGLNLSCIDFRNIPQVAVEAIFARREHAQLGPRWPPLSRNTSASNMLYPKLAGNGSANAWPGRRDIPSFAVNMPTLPFGMLTSGLLTSDVVEDVDQEPGMKTGRKDLGLRTVLAVHGNDAALP